MSSARKKTSSIYSAVPVADGAKTISLKYYLAAALIILFTIGATYSYFKFSKATEFSAKSVYEEAFVEPLSSITELTGSRGNSLAGFDSWIRFKSAINLTLRNDKEFKPYLADVGRSMFADKYPLDTTLQQPPNQYEYRIAAEQGVGKVVNQALLLNTRTHEYFYRIWGM